MERWVDQLSTVVDSGQVPAAGAGASTANLATTLGLLRFQVQYPAAPAAELPASAAALGVTGAWMLSRREVVAYPAKQVLALAEKVAKGKDAGLRFRADMTAVSNDTKTDPFGDTKTDPLEQPVGYRSPDQA